MPTDLAFKFAARQAIFAFLEKQHGEGWWGSEKMADYYAQQSSGDDPFNWIKTHPLMSPDVMAAYPFDHAGQGETSLLMALCPEGVDLARLSDAKWYTRSARDSSAELGAEGRERILAGLRKVLGA
jgi:creatinine amidohydrolase/Fe(II)-dependent formamide hydrolase-like protein